MQCSGGSFEMLMVNTMYTFLLKVMTIFIEEPFWRRPFNLLDTSYTVLVLRKLKK